MNNNVPKEKVCRNCRNTWREGDKYCRYCGAPMNNPDYKIEEFYTIYGPRPIRRKHVCSKCNYTWETQLMIDRENHCPKCGAKVSTEEDDDDLRAEKPVPAKDNFLHRLFGKKKG